MHTHLTLDPSHQDELPPEFRDDDVGVLEQVNVRL